MPAVGGGGGAGGGLTIGWNSCASGLSGPKHADEVEPEVRMAASVSLGLEFCERSGVGRSDVDMVGLGSLFRLESEVSVDGLDRSKLEPSSPLASCKSMSQGR